ncbi:MAG: mechanosensitive ion channel [Actinomycetaceae bacterium]|nr:mechanosensitive ion channel [Actinomycetaceae bacterium]MDY6083511.1 mechanosensitive ion channel [Actinomycetaceae bacterium]
MSFSLIANAMLSSSASVLPFADPSPSPSEGDLADVAVAATVDTLALVVGSVVGFMLGFFVAWIITGVLRAFGRRRPALATLQRQTKHSFDVLMAIVGSRIGFFVAVKLGGVEPSWSSPIYHIYLILIILAVAALAVDSLAATQESYLARLKHVGQSRYRRAQTQLQILHRVIAVVIWVVALAAVLLTFPAARAAGASVLASAGIASVIAGIAAQGTLGNMFAGLQLAFSDSIRMNDIVIWQGEYAYVEEITLTYVVLKIWDGRRLIVPSSQMTTQTFENWTRRAPDLVGSVDLLLDWQAPVDALRAHLNSLLASTDMWDGGTGTLVVQAADNGRILIRLMVSAKDSSTLTDLKNFVREHMVAYIQNAAPQAIPRVHIQSAGMPALDAGLSAGDGSFGQSAPAAARDAAGAEISVREMPASGQPAVQDESAANTGRAAGSGQAALVPDTPYPTYQGADAHVAHGVVMSADLPITTGVTTYTTDRADAEAARAYKAKARRRKGKILPALMKTQVLSTSELDSLKAKVEKKKLDKKKTKRQEAESDAHPADAADGVGSVIQSDALSDAKNAGGSAGYPARVPLAERLHVWDGAADAAQAEGGVQIISGVHTMNGVEPGHESSIFTGSAQAMKRAEDFSGPGDDAFREREAEADLRLKRQSQSEAVDEATGGKSAETAEAADDGSDQKPDNNSDKKLDGKSGENSEEKSAE